MAQAITTNDTNVLTSIEYLQARQLGEDEFERGNLHDVIARFTHLLNRIEAQPSGTSYGPGSLEHATTLALLARCLRSGQQLAAAERLLRQSLKINDTLLEHQPKNDLIMDQRSNILNDLADVQLDLGQYAEARETYEAGLAIDKQLNNVRGQAATERQLGTLAES